jgi:hypothetical protein
MSRNEGIVTKGGSPFGFRESFIAVYTLDRISMDGRAATSPALNTTLWS